MIQSYKKLLEKESDAVLKLEKAKRELEEIRKVLYQEKEFIIDRLITYFKRELNVDYNKYKIKDMDDNTAEILVKNNSQIFENYIEGKEFFNSNIEELIDNRKFNNEDEIIILDLNFDEKLLNLGYMCDSLDYNYLSYSKNVKEKISMFIDYIVNKNIYKK